jgi:cytochrome P450
MLDRREDPSIPVWSRDQLGSSYLPEVEASYFDESLNALVLSRHADATADVNVNGSFIRKGDHLILRIIAENPGLERFSCPSYLDLTRRDGGHFALGARLHACGGASLIRMVTDTITHPLLQRFASASPALSRDHPIDWQGAPVFRSPRSLWVYLREDRE